MNISTALQALIAALQPYSDTARQDAEVLLAHILSIPRTDIIAHPEQDLKPEQQAQLTAVETQLENGTPLPYIIGEWTFYGRMFSVTPAVLIPRPETELLIEHALKWLTQNPTKRTALEIGTGSGIIPITLTCEIADLTFTATDISPDAVTVARHNARRHAVADRINISQADLMAGLPQAKVDLICANLPYIPAARVPTLAIYGKEPTIALTGGDDGLHYIRKLLADAPPILNPGGLILLEIDTVHGESSPQLARQYFPHAKVEVFNDLAGHARLLQIETGATA